MYNTIKNQIRKLAPKHSPRVWVTNGAIPEDACGDDVLIIFPGLKEGYKI